MRPNYKAAKTSKVMINVYLIDIIDSPASQYSRVVAPPRALCILNL